MIGRDTRVQDFTIRLVLEGDEVRDKTIEFCGPADITRERTGAIVNAANSSLLGGGGVDDAIHRAGGPAILAECRQIVSKIGSLQAGKAVITTGGNLAAKYVIHTVGPIYHSGDQHSGDQRDGDEGEAEKLASCHRESIRLADEHAIESLSFPAISTGAFGYPVSQAAPVAIAATIDALRSANHVGRVRFVLFDVATLQTYIKAAEKFRSSCTAFPLRIEKASS